ncbi:hypothetical protein LTR53_010186 [Teratosphaeriaceae sp. CCFEE 6253]|nr:hypothetical protein LTR53_010186 [Teratosphaeriaceae sp. CCFEE 6253]
MAGMARFQWAKALVATLATLTAAEQPNILFVLTDDQDWHMQSLDYMPLLHKHMINEGTLYDGHYCTVAVCCPSRVNLWTGKAAHTTNVTDLFPPYGGYPKFVEEGLNEDWFPVSMQQLGYNTYYTGKLFNAHNVDNYNAPYVKGFNGSDFLLDPYTYEYYRAHMTRNGAPPVSYEGQHSPDVVADKAYDFLDEATSHPEPWFLAVAPIAPHSDVRFVQPSQFNMAKYAPRHAHLFKDYKIPRTADFNPDVPSGVGWVRELPQFYTTDNGYHISQHRMHPGKECPYETDIHIPLVVRGPGIPAGHTAGVVSSHTDLAPTMLKLAGRDRPDLDGTPIPLDAESLASPKSGEHVNVEFSGRAIPEGKYGKIGNDTLPEIGGQPTLARNNTYKALRVIGEGYSLLYTVWCTGDREYYDLNSRSPPPDSQLILHLQRDPDEMRNYLGEDDAALTANYSLGGRSFEQVLGRLDALLMVLKSCKSASCHKPWTVLHPGGNIATLQDALHDSFDAFYAKQPKVGFSSCQLGYLIGEEGPQHANAWENEAVRGLLGGKQQSFQYYGDPSLWT